MARPPDELRVDDPLGPARGWARHEQAKRALQRVVALCDADGIGVLPVKGVLTARLFYADPADRWIQDVDLRVLPASLPRIRAAAARAGLRELSWSSAFENLVLEVAGMMVELEAHVGPPGMCGLSVARMLERASVREAPFGFPHREPELHDHALLLCVNAFKDKLVCAAPGAVEDLARLPQQNGFDAERLAELARESEVATLLSITATWMVERRGVSAWSPVLRAIGAPPRASYARAIRWLMDRPVRSEAPLLLRILARDAADGAGRRFRVAATTSRYLLERARLARSPRRV